MKKILLLLLFSSVGHSYVFDPDCIEALDQFKEQLFPEELLFEEVRVAEKGIFAFNTKSKNKDFEEFTQILEVTPDALWKLRSDNIDYPISCKNIYFEEHGSSFGGPEASGLGPLAVGIKSLMTFNEVMASLKKGKIHEELVKARKWSFKDITDQDILKYYGEISKKRSEKKKSKYYLIGDIYRRNSTSIFVSSINKMKRKDALREEIKTGKRGPELKKMHSENKELVISDADFFKNANSFLKVVDEMGDLTLRTVYEIAMLEYLNSW